MIIAICHNIRSAYNIGSIIRTAECAGIDKIYLTGYSPAPELEKVKKISLGAEKSAKWEYSKNISKILDDLKKRGFFIISMETLSKAEPLDKFDFKKKNIALIFGNEKRGLSHNILKRSDAIVKIPMFGKKESLNVSVAFGIACYFAVLKK